MTDIPDPPLPPVGYRRTRFQDPSPTGIHHEVISRLDGVRAMLAHMPLASPGRENLTLGDVYDSQIAALIGSVDTHYKMTWWEVATRPLAVEFPNPTTESNPPS